MEKTVAIDLRRTDSFPRKEAPLPLARLSARRRTPSGPMLLLEESRGRFTKLVAAYQGLWRDQPQERLRILTLLRDEFATHCGVERESLYPLVVKREDPSVPKRIEEAELEHRVIEAMLQELSQTAPNHGWFGMLMKTLSIRFQRHGDQLEAHLFPLAGTMPVVIPDVSLPAAARRRTRGNGRLLLSPTLYIPAL